MCSDIKEKGHEHKTGASLFYKTDGPRHVLYLIRYDFFHVKKMTEPAKEKRRKRVRPPTCCGNAWDQPWRRYQSGCQTHTMRIP